MCIAVDLFQAASVSKKWLITLLIIVGVFSCVYWLVLVPIVYECLTDSPHSVHWVQHWKVIYFALCFLIWSLIMFLLVGIWYLYRKRAFRNLEDSVLERTALTDANSKVRQTLGLDEDVEKLTKNYLQRKASKNDLEKKQNVSELNFKSDELTEIQPKEITPLPEYSPEARDSIFDFSDERTEEYEKERARSPFQEFLHLVQLESPSTPILESIRKGSLTVVKEDEEESKESEEAPGMSKEEEAVDHPLVKAGSGSLNEDDHKSSEESIGKVLDNLKGQESEFSDLEEPQHPNKKSEDSIGGQDYEEIMHLLEPQDKVDGRKSSEESISNVLDNLKGQELEFSEPQDANNKSEDSIRGQEDGETVPLIEPQSSDEHKECIGETLDHSEEQESEIKEPVDEIEPQKSNEDDDVSVPPKSPGEISSEGERRFDLSESDEENDKPEIISELPAIAKVHENAGMKAKTLIRKESKMFLGNIGKANSVISEMYVEVDHGNVIADSAIVMGNFQLLTGPELNAG